jgi:hypothetical protein
MWNNKLGMETEQVNHTYTDRRSGAGLAQSVYYSVWLRALYVRMIGVRSPEGTKEFSCNLCVQTGSEAHPAYCTMGTGGSFPRG